MQFEEFRRFIKSDIFDYQSIKSFFKLKKTRDKLSSLVASGKVIRIRKGLYAFGENWRLAPLDLEVVANLIYGPSCISFEYALNRYGLIAERAETITSLAIGDSKTYDTPLGRFEYRAIDPMKFKVGIEYRNLPNDGGYFIASREKALADLVYRTPGIRTLDQLRHFLFEEMRVDESLFRSLNFSRLEEIATIYKKQSVHSLGKL